MSKPVAKAALSREITSLKKNVEYWKELCREKEKQSDYRLLQIKDRKEQIAQLKQDKSFLSQQIVQLKIELSRCLGWIDAREGKHPLQSESEEPTDSFGQMINTDSDGVRR